MKRMEKELTLIETILACIVPMIAMFVTHDFMETFCWTALVERVIYPLIKEVIYVTLEDHRDKMIREGTY